MIHFLQALSTICFAWLFIGFFVGNISFLKLFNKLKNEEPAYLDSKIKKYSFFDARTQLAGIIIQGKYQDLNNQTLKTMLYKQRIMMIAHLVITVFGITSFILSVVLAHHIL